MYTWDLWMREVLRIMLNVHVIKSHCYSQKTSEVAECFFSSPYISTFYEKFMQSFNMWIKIPVYEIDFWTVVVLLVCEILGHQNIWKNQIAYCIYMYTLKGVGCVRVWTHLRYILVLEWCQQIVRYACNIHIAFVC